MDCENLQLPLLSTTIEFILIFIQAKVCDTATMNVALVYILTTVGTKGHANLVLHDFKSTPSYLVYIVYLDVFVVCSLLVSLKSLDNAGIKAERLDIILNVVLPILAGVFETLYLGFGMFCHSGKTPGDIPRAVIGLRPADQQEQKGEQKQGEQEPEGGHVELSSPSDS